MASRRCAYTTPSTQPLNRRRCIFSQLPRKFFVHCNTGGRTGRIAESGVRSSPPRAYCESNSLHRSYNLSFSGQLRPLSLHKLLPRTFSLLSTPFFIIRSCGAPSGLSDGGARTPGKTSFISSHSSFFCLHPISWQRLQARLSLSITPGEYFPAYLTQVTGVITVSNPQSRR